MKDHGSLAITHPHLIQYWHSTKNGTLKPTDVTCGSGKEVWWYMPYDDPKTCKHFDFEWRTTVLQQCKYLSICPYLTNAKVWTGYNDLATMNPQLASEWHPTKNGNLKPTQISPNCNKKAWWYLPYDDPKTGKHFDFEWEAVIANRMKGHGCPYLSGRAVWAGFNDLATTHPQLAAEWHPTKNGDLKPTDVSFGYDIKIWWYLPYDDPKTGKHFDFEWQTSINSRSYNNSGCPYLYKGVLYAGFNDLATTHPQLATEWHPTKNGNLKPTDITAGSDKKVWWYLPYDDPKTGKHFDFEWDASIFSRTKGVGCPYLTGHAVWNGFNDLATLYPKLAAEWHPTKNGNLKPTDVLAGGKSLFWWYLSYDDAKTGKHFDFEWRVSIDSRTGKNSGCPYLSGRAVWAGFNDLATTHPQLLAEWHPTKNGNLKPTDVTAGSDKQVWWYLPYDDPKTGKHFDFEWQTAVKVRAIHNLNCPYLSGQKVWQGFNDLHTTHPQLASEWHPTKNGTLKPTDVTAGSTKKKVWWYLPYDDPKTGKHFDFEWEAFIANRMKGHGCPYLSGRAVWIGFNDLVTVNPQLAAEWHPTKNGKLRPTDVTAGSDKKVWWLYEYINPKTGKHFDFEWDAVISSRNTGVGCPYLSSSKTELLIHNFLYGKKVIFEIEKSFNNCRRKGRLLFDVFLTNKNIIIEADGIQHFEPIGYFGGKKQLGENIIRDNIKNDFCKSQNIPLLRIPYIYDPIVDKDKIEKFVLDFIQTKQVPQEIKDFYAKYSFSNYCK